MNLSMSGYTLFSSCRPHAAGVAAPGASRMGLSSAHIQSEPKEEHTLTLSQRGKTAERVGDRNEGRSGSAWAEKWCKRTREVKKERRRGGNGDICLYNHCEISFLDRHTNMMTEQSRYSVRKV